MTWGFHKLESRRSEPQAHYFRHRDSGGPRNFGLFAHCIKTSPETVLLDFIQELLLGDLRSRITAAQHFGELLNVYPVALATI